MRLDYIVNLQSVLTLKVVYVVLHFTNRFLGLYMAFHTLRIEASEISLAARMVQDAQVELICSKAN